MEERKMTIEERIDSALAAIRQRTSAAPEIGLILGSGLGDFCDRLEDRIEVPFDQLPGFPLPTVEGHAGAFVFGTYLFDFFFFLININFTFYIPFSTSLSIPQLLHIPHFLPTPCLHKGAPTPTPPDL